jgi:hypothetical protein
LQRKLNGVVAEDGTLTNPKKRPAPNDPPSNKELHRAEALLARSRSKKTIEHSVRKKVLEHMVLSRLKAKASSMQSLLSVLSEGSTNPTSDTASLLSTLSSTGTTGPTKSDYVEFLFQSVSTSTYYYLNR